MNGFKEDVLSILRTNIMLHNRALGFIVGTRFSPDAGELYKDLVRRKFPVTDRRTKPVVLYDYVVIPEGWGIETLLHAFGNLSENGLIVIQIMRGEAVFERKYVSLFGKFTGTLVTYEDRSYLVIHSGVDYGN